MASWTDEVSTFNPYIQDLPVEDMINVGMLKQEQYNQGVAKVQAYRESIAGIDVIKDEHKDYVNQRVKQLDSELSKVVGADFSRNQLVSSIGGLARKISNDPIIQNAMISTARVQKAKAALDEARTTGKGYSAENEWALNNEVSKWLNDKDTESSFSGTYVPYTDVKKKILDVIKTVDPDSTLTQLPFSTNEDGTLKLDENGQPIFDYAMVERSMKGKSPEKLVAAIQASLDENDLRQLGISGAYHYRNYTPEDMHQILKNNTTTRGQQLMLKKDQLTVEVANAEGDEKDALEEQLGLIDEQLGRINESYSSAVKQLSANPEGFKSQFYIQNAIDGLGTAFSSSEQSTKYLTNPKLQGYIDLENLGLRRQELDLKKQELEIKAQNERDKADKASKKKDQEESAPGEDYGLRPEDTPALDELSFQQGTFEVASQKNNIIDRALKGLNFNDQELLTAAKGRGMTPEAYKEEIFSQFVERYKKGQTIKDNMVGAVQEYLALQKDIDTRQSAYTAAVNKANKEVPGFTALDLAKTVTGGKATVSDGWGFIKYNGKEVDFAPEDLVNIATLQVTRGFMGTLFNSAEEDSRVQTAKSNIIKKYGQELGEKIIKKAYDSDFQEFAPQLRAIGEAFNSPEYKKRQKVISDELNKTGKVGKPVVFDLHTGKPEVFRDVQTQASGILSDANRLGGGPGNRDEVLKKLMAKEGTGFRVVWQPKGDVNQEQFLLEVTNGGESETVPITKTRAEGLSGRIFDSTVNAIEAKINSVEQRSTNPADDPKKSFIHNYEFKKLRDFKNVSGDVDEDIAHPGNYYLKLHVYDPNSERYVTVPARLRDQREGGLTITEIQSAINNLTDSDVRALIAPKKPQ